MPDLNESQFAKYSARRVPHPTLEYEIKPLPASLERHGKGSYQPTLPGMERMLPGEQTHTEVFFKSPKPAADEWGDPHGSRWFDAHSFTPLPAREEPRMGTVSHDNLRPMQDWVDENHVNSPPRKRTAGKPPMVEYVPGQGNILQDGHHRVVRDMLAGLNRSRVARWG